MNSHLSLFRVPLSLFNAAAAATGALVFPHENGQHALTAFIAFIGVMLLSFGASGLNQFQEREIDVRMQRTRMRPLPSGTMAPAGALTASILAVVTGSLVLALGASISYMDDRLLEKLDTDIRYCWPGLLPNSPITRGEDDNTFYDSYGQVWKRALPYYYTGEGILKDANSIDDIEARVRWPDLSDPRWIQGVAERARTLKEQTDYFVTMRMVASHGPFQTACDLRGTEAFLMDMALNPEFAHALLDKVTTAIEGLIQLAMRAGGKYFDMMELPGEIMPAISTHLFLPRCFASSSSPALNA